MPLFFQIFYSLAPKIEICLRYFLGIFFFKSRALLYRNEKGCSTDMACAGSLFYIKALYYKYNYTLYYWKGIPTYIFFWKRYFSEFFENFNRNSVVKQLFSFYRPFLKRPCNKSFVKKQCAEIFENSSGILSEKQLTSFIGHSLNFAGFLERPCRFFQ